MFNHGWIYQKPRWKEELEWNEKRILAETGLSKKKLDEVIEILEKYRVLY